MEQIIKISDFIFKSFLHIWPYLLITIPLSVLVNLSGASKYIKSAFSKKPMLAIFMATIVGAFSPFCSCGVIPVISSLLLGGVPIAPVMSFWIASPSMDPEIFFLSSSVLGWKLAIWRLASTFTISMLAGYITHFAARKGYFGNNILRTKTQKECCTTLRRLIHNIKASFPGKQESMVLISKRAESDFNICCPVSVDISSEKGGCSCQSALKDSGCNDSDMDKYSSQWKRVASEIFKAVLLVTKFMGIAFLITALLNYYVPVDVINRIIGVNPILQIILATLIGIPVYTSNITALPLVGGLIDLGLNNGAALSFLIAGATTTLPAMTAVWGITHKRVFLLYLSFALAGSLLAGLIFNLFN
jgi:uncharacterized membrane protein YraQ (UPF0718 family)